jgi:TolA-binding protein
MAICLDFRIRPRHKARTSRAESRGANTMSDSEQTTAQVSEGAQPTPPELEELKEMAARHGRRVLILAVVTLVVAASFGYLILSKRNAANRASELLDKARNPQDLEVIVRDYPRTPVAPAAKLRLARSLYDRNDFARAEATYTDFVALHPDHPMKPVAEMGRIHCLEGKGLLEDALKGFETFATQHRDDFLASQAIIGKARCQHLLGRTADARITLEDFLASHPQSKWIPRVEEMIELLKAPIAATPTPPMPLPVIGIPGTVQSNAAPVVAP